VLHPGAFAFAMRPDAEAMRVAKMAGAMIESMTDPQTGLSFSLELQRQHKQTVWILSALYGSAPVRPELACRIAG